MSPTTGVCSGYDNSHDHHHRHFMGRQESLPIQKVVDETAFLKRPRRGSMLKEEVWESADGEVVRYSLAYINPNICGLEGSHDV
jgi:hypothetical protein